MSDFRFRGFPLRGTKIRWSDKALANFKHWVRELTGAVGGAMTIPLKKLGNFLRAWFGFFGMAEYYRPIPHGVSGKRYSHMARTPAVQQALSNA